MKHLSKDNPLEYIYNFPVDKVRHKIKDEITKGRLGETAKFDNYNEILLNWYGVFSVGKSEIYYNWFGRFKLYSSYRIILDSVSNDCTKIRVESHPVIQTGYYFETSHGIPILAPLREEVDPSTVEEYEIIKMIGDDLGEKNMPPIIKPTFW